MARHEDHAARFAMIRAARGAASAARSASWPTCRARSCASAGSRGGRVHLQTGQPFRLDLNPTPGDAWRVNLPHPEIIEAAQIGMLAAAGRRQAAAAGGARARRRTGDRGGGRRSAVGPQGRQRARRGAADPGADRRRTATTWPSRWSTASTTSACRSCSGRRMWPRRKR